MKQNRVLAVIPARGGSKGVPGKNIKLLNGRPLIAYTIEAALESRIFDKVIVSTDDGSIADVAKQYGAEVPFVRPAELAGDLVSSDDVILHALQFLRDNGEEYDVVCKLQPTSPLRKSAHIKEAYKAMLDKKSNYIVSVCECEHSPLWAGNIGEDLNMDNFIKEENIRACRQSLDKFYRLNGAIYMGDVSNYELDKSFLGKGCIAYIMDQKDSVDIDSELDFLVAKVLMKNYVNG